MKKDTFPGYENIISFPDMVYDTVDEGDVLEVKLARCTPHGIEERSGFTAVLYKAEIYNSDGKLQRHIGLSPLASSITELAIQPSTVYSGNGYMELVSEGEKEPWVVFFPAIAHWRAAENIVAKYRDVLERTSAAGLYY